MPDTKRNFLTLCIILIICCLGQFGSDIYAPALPAISQKLSTSTHWVQFSMAIYMFGAAISMLIYGPLSEGIGRKKPIAIGLVIFMLGTIFCWSATQIGTLILGRLIQGVGVGAAMGLWRAVFRDLFTGQELAKMGSYFSILVTFIIPAAPMLGGYLQHFFDWQSIFFFLFIYGIGALVLLLLVKETSQNHHLEKLRLTYIIKNYKALFVHRDFIVTSIVVFITFGAFFSWFAVSPVLLIKQLGMTTVTYGWVNFIGCGLMFSVAGWINGRYVERVGSSTMLKFGWSIITLAGFLLLIGYWMVGSTVVITVMSGMLLYFGATFIWPNAFANAMTPFGHAAGYAGTTYSLIQISGGAILGSLVAHLPNGNPIVLGLVFVVLPMLATAIYFLIPAPKMDVAVELKN